MAKQTSTFKRVWQLVNLVGGITTLYLMVIRPWHLKWGATDEEVNRALPGDDLISNPKINATHAITIAAPIDEVWPWIAQIGQGRGGFYSYEAIENALGELRGEKEIVHLVPGAAGQIDAARLGEAPLERAIARTGEVKPRSKRIRVGSIAQHDEELGVEFLE